MMRDYWAGIAIVAITIILTVLLWLLLGNRNDSVPVYILVVDEFDKSVQEGASETSDNCVVNPTGTVIGLTGGGTIIGLTGGGTVIGLTGGGTYIDLSGKVANIDPHYYDMSHGAIVREVLETMVGSDFPHDHIINVDLDSYDTNHALDRIKQTIAEIGPAYYIVNMSFAMVPCHYIPSLEEYSKLLNGTETQIVIPGKDRNARLEELFSGTVRQALIDGTKIENDPLQNYISQSCSSRHAFDGGANLPEQTATPNNGKIVSQSAEEPVPLVPEFCDLLLGAGNNTNDGELTVSGVPASIRGSGILFVAAAGNGALDFITTHHNNITYPFAPALWDDVISVSTADAENKDGILIEPSDRFSVTGLSLASYSNYGAVMLPSPYHGIAGTSFAAPRYASLLALMITSHTTVTSSSGDCFSGALPLPIPDHWEVDPVTNTAKHTPPPPNKPVC